MGNGGLGESGWAELRGFDVDVCLYETGQNVMLGRFLQPFHCQYPTVGKTDPGGIDLALDDVHELPLYRPRFHGESIASCAIKILFNRDTV